MIGFLIAALFFTGCKKKDTVAPELSVSPSDINLPSEGGTADVTITGNAQWRNIPKDLDTHNDAVDYWITYVTKQAIAHGIKPFWWDTGGILDRRNNTVVDQRSLDALIAGTK